MTYETRGSVTLLPRILPPPIHGNREIQPLGGVPTEMVVDAAENQ